MIRSLHPFFFCFRAKLTYSAMYPLYNNAINVRNPDFWKFEKVTICTLMFGIVTSLHQRKGGQPK